MALGIVDDSEFEKELSRSVDITIPNVPEMDIVNNPDKGRGKGSPEIPNSLRQIIGEESVINGRQSALALAETFGVSPSSVSAYANGSTSTKTYDKQPGLDHLNRAKIRIGSKARKAILRAMEHLTEEKLSETDGPGLANIAKSMSAISKEMEPADPRGSLDGNGNGPTINYILYAPQIKREEQYEVINARE